jgi:hypothetical protein
MSGGWFDAFKGFAFQGKGVKIATNADGSKVWVEREGETHILSATERAMLVDTARDMGAVLVDPDGVYRDSVRFEAHLESQSADVHYRANIHSDFFGGAYNERTYREMQQNIADKEREELAKVGRRG